MGATPSADPIRYFRGQMLLPGTTQYDAARRISNERMARRPASILRCAGVADVCAALELATGRRLEISVRGGGHGVAGWASTEGGLVIDLTLMRGVRVNPEECTAWVGAGSVAADLLIEAARFGLAPVTGMSPSVGLGGLLTGLGEGYLTPLRGFGIDNVLEIELVTVDGEFRRSSATEHPELFWALRGAGPNFGVVTAFKVRLHPMPKQAIGGWITFGWDDADRVSRHLWEILRAGSAYFCPVIDYTRTDRGDLVINVLPGHTGPPEVARRELQALQNCAPPVSDLTRTMTYVDLVHEIPGTTSLRQHWDTWRFDFTGDPRRQIALLLEQAETLTPKSSFSLWRTVPFDGVVSPGVAPRLPGITVCIMSRWADNNEDQSQIAWNRSVSRQFEASDLVSEASNAMNHVSDVVERRVRDLYGESAYRQLSELKADLDPENLLHRNYNVPPAGRTAAR